MSLSYAKAWERGYCVALGLALNSRHIFNKLALKSVQVWQQCFQAKYLLSEIRYHHLHSYYLSS